MRYGFVVLLLLASALLFAGQPNSAELQSARNTFPYSDAIYLSKNEHLTIDLVKGELKLSTKVDERIYFATDKSDLYRKYYIYHSFFSDLSPVDALIQTQVNGKYKEFKVNNFTTEDNVSANVFYDDLKQVGFTFPAVSAGAVGCISYAETLKDPHFLPPFYFSSYMPIMDCDYSVTFPSSVRLHYKVFNNDSGRVVFNKEQKGKITTYSWHIKNVKDQKHEEDAPGYPCYAPHVLVTVSDYDKNGKVENVLPDLNGMCEWYNTFVKDINKKDDSTLIGTVRSVIKDALTGEEKVRAIYYWVQDHIHYIAFEDGMNGLIPREANDICLRRYGDCKDMSSILVRMLRIAGVDAHYAWIGSRRLPYRYSDIASASIDNHMICIADLGAKRYILDGTAQFTPLGFVTGFIQGKEALILKDDAQCEVYQIPVTDAGRSLQVDTIVLSLKDQNTIDGTISETLTGYDKITESYLYHYAQPDQRNGKIEEHLKMGNNKCKISGIRLEGFFGKDSTMRILSDFSLSGYIKNIGEKIYINPSLEKAWQKDKIDLTSRKLPYEQQYKSTKKSVTIINIPEGYEISYKPEDISFRKKEMEFSVNYVSKANQIIQVMEIKSDFLMMPVEAMPEWNKMLDAINIACKENIVFKKTKTL